MDVMRRLSREGMFRVFSLLSIDFIMILSLGELDICSSIYVSNELFEYVCGIDFKMKCMFFGRRDVGVELEVIYF